MQQLIEILSERPIIIAILIFWPVLLWTLKECSQKIYFKFEKKK